MMVPLSNEEINAHATTLATTLIEENRDYVSAAQIYIDHLHDTPVAARLLCRGSRFADATRILTLHGHQGLIGEIVDTGLAEAMGSMTDLIADCRSQLNSQVPRIRELRIRRIEDPLAFFGGDPTTADGAGAMDIPDNVSLAPTEASTLAGRSMFTRYTGKTTSSRMTSKTRRREERKRARGKKGTVYEEEYLVNSVRRLTERVNSTIPEAESLVDALLRRGMRERAAAIERALTEVLNMCKECREEIFEVPTVSAAATGGEENGDNVGQQQQETAADGMELPGVHGGESVFLSSVLALSENGKGREAPAVKELKRTALL